MNISALATAVVGAAVLMGLAPSDARAQTKYFARQHLAGLKSTSSTSPSDPASTGDFRWSSAAYGQWSSTCNAKSTRTRAVTCLDANDAVVSDSQCSAAGTKPQAQETMLIVSDCSGELRNGSFESGLTNWTVSGDATAPAANAAAGARSLRLFSQGDPGEARQTFSTIPGVTYTLSFKGYREGYNPGVPYYIVSDSGSGVVANKYLSGSDQTGNKVYLPYSVTWKATGTTATVLFFVGTRGGYYLMYVDDVRLSATQ